MPKASALVALARGSASGVALGAGFVLQLLRHPARAIAKRMHRVGGLVAARAAQAGQAVADAPARCRRAWPRSGLRSPRAPARRSRGRGRPAPRCRAGGRVRFRSGRSGGRRATIARSGAAGCAARRASRRRPATRREIVRACRTQCGDRVGSARSRAVQRSVGAAQPQRQAVGGAAERGEVVVLRATGAGAARTAAVARGRGAGAGRESAGHVRPPARGSPRRTVPRCAADGARRLASLTPAITRARADDSSSSRSKQRWKYSATIGRSASSHLLRNDSAKASARSPKISQVLGPGDHGARRHQRRQVAGREALARQVGHRHHPAHQRAARRRSRSAGTRASTIATSSSAGR